MHAEFPFVFFYSLFDVRSDRRFRGVFVKIITQIVQHHCFELGLLSIAGLREALYVEPIIDEFVSRGPISRRGPPEVLRWPV